MRFSSSCRIPPEAEGLGLEEQDETVAHRMLVVRGGPQKADPAQFLEGKNQRPANLRVEELRAGNLTGGWVSAFWFCLKELGHHRGITTHTRYNLSKSQAGLSESFWLLWGGILSPESSNWLARPASRPGLRRPSGALAAASVPAAENVSQDGKRWLRPVSACGRWRVSLSWRSLRARALEGSTCPGKRGPCPA